MSVFSGFRTVFDPVRGRQCSPSVGYISVHVKSDRGTQSSTHCCMTDVRKCRKTSSRSVKKIGNVNIDPYSQSDQHGNLITSIGSPLAHVYELSLVDIHQHVRELSCGHRHTPTGVIQGGTGGRSPQNFGWGDDIAHIPPINYPHSYEKLPFAWIQ